MPIFPPTKLIAAGTFERVPIAGPSFCLVFHLSDLFIACSRLFRIKLEIIIDWGQEFKLLFPYIMKAGVGGRASIESRLITEICFVILWDASKVEHDEQLKLSWPRIHDDIIYDLINVRTPPFQRNPPEQQETRGQAPRKSSIYGTWTSSIGQWKSKETRKPQN